MYLIVDFYIFLWFNRYLLVIKGELIMNINNLKIGDRVKFAPNTFAQVTNYETDISNQFGTVVNFTISHDGTYDTHVWIELDERNEHFDCDEWGNAVQFNLTDDMDGGTSVDYLKKATLLKEVK